MLGQGAGGPRLWRVGGPGFSPPVRTPREVRGSGRPARRGLGAGLGLGVPQGCWKGRHLPTFRGPDAARTWQASLWQEPAAPASVYLVRQMKLEKTPPPYATQNQRALQKRPVLPRRPLALTPRPRRGRAGAERAAVEDPAGGRTGTCSAAAVGWSLRGPRPAGAGGIPKRASTGGRTCPPSQGQSAAPRLQDRGRRAPAALPPTPPTHISWDWAARSQHRDGGHSRLGPRSVPHTPCLGGEVPRGDVLGGGLQVRLSWLWASSAFQCQKDGRPSWKDGLLCDCLLPCVGRSCGGK